MKQIIQIEHNQLATVIMKQIQVVVRPGREPGTAGLRVRRDGHSARLPLRTFPGHSRNGTIISLVAG